MARPNLLKSKANDISPGEEVVLNANPRLAEEPINDVHQTTTSTMWVNEPHEDPETLSEGDPYDGIAQEPTVLGATVQRISTAQTHHSERTALGRVLTGIHVRDRRSYEGHGDQVFVVHWESPSDPLNPRHWPIARRIGATLQISMIGLFLTAASGIDATVLPQAAADLNVSETAESLATGLP